MFYNNGPAIWHAESEDAGRGEVGSGEHKIKPERNS